MITETLIIHGGDLVEWHERSGFANKPPQRIPPATLRIEFNRAPQALYVHHKPQGTLLWHKNSAGPSKVVKGIATDADKTAQPITSYPIDGNVSDPSGRYLPRIFSFTIGSNSEHQVSLYHSPFGARFSNAGGIYGQVGFDDGKTAAWALITLTVTPSLGAPLKFVAQSDIHGEFSLPLNRLPALTKDAPTTTYSATLEVKARHSTAPEALVDPDTLTQVDIANGKNSGGNSLFVKTLNLAIAPGTVAKVVSPNHTLIVIKST